MVKQREYIKQTLNSMFTLLLKFQSKNDFNEDKRNSTLKRYFSSNSYLLKLFKRNIIF